MEKQHPGIKGYHADREVGIKKTTQDGKGKKHLRKKSGKRRPGRPPYTPSQKHFDTAYEGAAKGLNESQIAESIGISYSTLCRYRDKFSESIKRGRDESDNANCARVEGALLKRVLGFKYDETSTETVTDAKGKPKYSKSKRVEKLVLPDPTSIFFWLVNRAPERWHSINKFGVDVGEGSAEKLAAIADSLARLDTDTKTAET